MNPALIGIAAILIFGGIAGHFNRYEDEDWKALRDEIRQGLRGFKQLVVTWPIRDSIIALVLTVLVSAWVISFI